MFGKPYGEYIRFQKIILVAIAIVGLVRLGLSLAGVPESTATFASMNAVGLVGVIYYGARVGPSGFGSYRHLLPLVFNRVFLVNAIAVLGIMISVMGYRNIFDVPEFRPPFAREGSAAGHALAHLTIGNIVPALLGWGVAALIMRIGFRPQRGAQTTS